MATFPEMISPTISTYLYRLLYSIFHIIPFHIRRLIGSEDEFLWKLLPGLKDRSTTLVNSSGQTLIVRLDSLGDMYAAFGRKDEKKIPAILKALPAGSVVLDVGAHIGGFSLIAAKSVGPTGKVFAFEPVHENVKLLEKNARINNLPWLISIQAAVARQKGTITLLTSKTDTMWATSRLSWSTTLHHGKTEENIIEINVPAITISEFLKEKQIPSVALMKIDVEAAEMDVLVGAVEALSAKIIDQIIVEVHSPSVKWDHIKAFLERYDYMISRIGDGELHAVINKNDKIKHNNDNKISDQLTIALIGCGAVAEILYAPALDKMAKYALAEVLCLVDPNEERLKILLKLFGTARTYNNIYDMFKNYIPDIAIIAVPHKYHREIAIACLEKGMHCFVEKPMAISTLETESMIQAVENSGKNLSVGYFRRLFRATQIIKTIIDYEILGKVTSFEFIEGENYSWPAVSDSFFSHERAGGGVLIDAGAHTTDLLFWWLGDYDSVDYYDDGNKVGVEADLLAYINMKSGVKGRLRLSRSTQLANKYKIYFQKGWIIWNCDDVNHFEMGLWQDVYPLDINAIFESTPKMTLRDSRKSKPPEFIDYFSEQIRLFIDDIVKKRKSSIDGKEASRNIRFIEDCYRNRKSLTCSWRDEKQEKIYIDSIVPLLKKNNYKKIGIIGASGFIGTRLTEYLYQLKDKGFDVLPIVRRINSGARLRSQGIDLIQADILDKQRIAEVIQGLDVIFCSFVGDTDVIMNGLKNVLRAAYSNGVKKVVYLSTQMAYGFNPPNNLAESAIPRPKQLRWYPYSRDKANAEKIIRQFQTKYKLDITVLRPAIVYGPHSIYWTQEIIESIMSGEAFLIDDGGGACDTIYVDDLVEAMIICAADNRSKNRSFNISDGNSTKWRDFFKIYCKYLNHSYESIRIFQSSGLHEKKSNTVMRFIDFQDTISEIKRHQVAVVDIVKTLPFGTRILKAGRKIIKSDMSLSNSELEMPSNKELLHMQNNKTFLKSDDLLKTIEWKARWKLHEGIKTAVEWYSFWCH